MRNGQCPKCGSRDVYMAESGTGIQRGESLTLPQGGVLDGVMTLKPKDYVCTACGYWESYIDDPKALAKIAELGQAGKRWKRVS